MNARAQLDSRTISLSLSNAQRGQYVIRVFIPAEALRTSDCFQARGHRWYLATADSSYELHGLGDRASSEHDRMCHLSLPGELLHTNEGF